MTALLYYGGIAIMILSVPCARLPGVRTYDLIAADRYYKIYCIMLILGLFLAIRGAVWKRKLYRCPKCGCCLFMDHARFSQKPPRYCGNCGIEIEICIGSEKKH